MLLPYAQAVRLLLSLRAWGGQNVFSAARMTDWPVARLFLYGDEQAPLKGGVPFDQLFRMGLSRVPVAYLRRHVHKAALQNTLERAVLSYDFAKKAGCQTLRHLFATHFLEGGYDNRRG